MTALETLFGVRESLLPGPSQSSGYRTVLIIGPTGAGKTTLAQQLIGSDPAQEHFLSTSTAKTTIAETELERAFEILDESLAATSKKSG